MKRQEGFTLVEGLVVMSIMAVLFAVSFGSLRNYWLTQSLYGSREEVTAQLKGQQARVTSETHPLVYGIRFPAAGSNKFGLVRYTPAVGTAPATCRQYATASTNSSLSPGGAQAVFPSTDYDPSTNPNNFGFKVTTETTFCRGNLTTPAGGTVTEPPVNATADQYAWFYARGTANAGRVRFTHTSLEGRALSLTVSALTGRVTTP